MIAVLAVSQPNSNIVIFNLTAAQAEEFLAETLYVFSLFALLLYSNLSSKHMEVFRLSQEFGWTVERQDVRKMVRFRSHKYGTLNSVKAYACALKGDGKIDKTIYSFFFAPHSPFIFFLFYTRGGGRSYHNHHHHHLPGLTRLWNIGWPVRSAYSLRSHWKKSSACRRVMPSVWRFSLVKLSETRSARENLNASSCSTVM